MSYRFLLVRECSSSTSGIIKILKGDFVLKEFNGYNTEVDRLLGSRGSAYATAPSLWEVETPLPNHHTSLSRALEGSVAWLVTNK